MALALVREGTGRIAFFPFGNAAVIVRLGQINIELDRDAVIRNRAIQIALAIQHPATRLLKA